MALVLVDGASCRRWFSLMVLVNGAGCCWWRGLSSVARIVIRGLSLMVLIVVGGARRR